MGCCTLSALYSFKLQKKYLGTLLIALGVLIRPETGLFAIFALIAKFKLSSLKPYILFGLLLTLPLIHNLIYGKKFILLTSGWNYGRNLDFNFLKNINYIVINPFNEKILMTLGSVIIYIGFSIVVLSSLNFVFSIIKMNSFPKYENYLFGILNLIPFFIYDPELFYPRHIIIGLCLISLNELYNDKLTDKIYHTKMVLNEKFS